MKDNITVVVAPDEGKKIGGSSPFGDVAVGEEEIVFVPDDIDNDSKKKMIASDEGIEEVLNVDEVEEPLDLSFSAKYRETVEAMKEERENDEESLKFPADCYSLMSLHGPSSGYFWYGFLVFIVQMLLIFLIVLSITLPQYSMAMVDDNPEGTILASFIASEADPLVRTTQAISLFVMIIFADSSMLDLVTAMHTFPNFNLATKKDKLGCIVFSCLLRSIQGFAALVVAFVLVISSNTVIDIILNFTALNFISALDDVAFEFAGNGKYGPKLEAEINRIAELELPVCMHRKNKYHRYVKTVIPLSLLIFGSFFTIVGIQEGDKFWSTDIVRVEIQNDKLQPYSGCYRKDNDLESYQRDFYYNERMNSTFGFCIDEKRWYLYQGNQTEPCDVDDEDIVVQSIDVDSFDISSSFLESWFTKKETPIDLYFVEDTEKIEPMCGHFLGDGICDEVFNNEFQNYDEGDCCATTCDFASNKCGIGGLANISGQPTSGFHNCKDPKYTSFTIQLNSIITSRDPKYIVLSEENQTYIDRFLPGFWTTKPEDVSFRVKCDDATLPVMHAFINDSNQGQMETIKITEGAECKISIGDTRTRTIQKWDDKPMWYVNYTIYKGDQHKMMYNPIRILEGHSHNSDVYNFQVVPQCYVEIFRDYVNTESIYGTENSPQSKVIRWLMDSIFRDTLCLDGIDLYVIVVLTYAATGTGDLYLENNTTDFCKFDVLECDASGIISGIDLTNLSLSGIIATEVGLLPDVISSFDGSKNNLTGTIPSEIGLLHMMTSLSLSSNKLQGSIPVDIGFATSLNMLHLAENNLTGTIPTEIGLLTNLLDLDLSDNSFIGVIPSEIGMLTSLTTLGIASGGLADAIPSEIGLLSNLLLLRIDSDFVDDGSNPELWKLKIVDDCIPCGGNNFKPNYNHSICEYGLKAFAEGNHRISIEMCTDCFLCLESDAASDGRLSLLDQETFP